jgi:hypothetical protein
VAACTADGVDEHGFVVVYPDGYERNWNDCRKAAAYPARKLRIDDAGLVFALVERLQSAIGADPARVFAIGYSNESGHSRCSGHDRIHGRDNAPAATIQHMRINLGGGYLGMSQ